MRYVVYVTADPVTQRYYIGKTNTRALRQGYQGSGWWVKELRATGFAHTLITQVMLEDMEEQEAYDAERFCVALCDHDPLCMNIVRGGGGFTKEQMAEVTAKLWGNPVYREKMQTVLRRINSDPEQREAARARLAAAVKSPEVRAAMSTAARERWAKVVKKVPDPRYLTWWTPERRAQQAERLRARKVA